IIPQPSEIYLPNPPWSSVIFNLPFYYTALLLLLCALAVFQWVRSSNFGLCLLAIGDDEDRALALGNNTSLYKLVAWAVSAIFVGMAGALNAYYFGSIDPTSAFERTINIALPVTAFIGGIGTLTGPLLGAIITVPLQQYLTVQYGNEQGLDLILYGILLLVVVIFLPQGLAPALQKHLLTGLSFAKKNSSVPALDLSDFPETPALGVSYAIMRENETRSQVAQPSEEFISRSNSVPLSLRRGYSAMKAPRLVPLSQEMATEGSANPSSGNGA
ncbi:MAG TPA: branched-chain amino acid ABC transporter permease, partial [Ktedonobacteraceae bacterium]